MKRFFILTLSLITTLAQARLIQSPAIIYVQTPFNQTISCYETDTPQNAFWQCRKKNLCSCPPNTLKLLYGHYEIKEGSECAYTHRFTDFAVQEKQALIQQPAMQPTYQNYTHSELTVIKLPNGELRYFYATQTFDDIFKACRDQKWCWKERLEIVYNGHSIIEGSQDALRTPLQLGMYHHNHNNNPAIIIQKGYEDFSFTELIGYIFSEPRR